MNLKSEGRCTECVEAETEVQGYYRNALCSTICSRRFYPS